MQNVHVPALGLQLAHQGNDAAEPAPLAVLDGADAVRIVEVNKCDAAVLAAGGRRCARDHQQANQDNGESFHHASMLT